ncbi:MAG: relaxase/mobilization nuclease domain-containing protein [Cetobacterium sp.]|uniref:relaxase/mobilization nuclease domain-containing protein n=1 Tax=Cetobacterium sp. TaxID=2071632 RepID=UPI003F3CDAE6
MERQKNSIKKRRRREYKHIIQSFKAGEVDREKALEIGVEFCEKAFLGHEVFIATHTDREHIMKSA